MCRAEREGPVVFLWYKACVECVELREKDWLYSYGFMLTLAGGVAALGLGRQVFY